MLNIFLHTYFAPMRYIQGSTLTTIIVIITMMLLLMTRMMMIIIILDKNPVSDPMTTAELAGLVIGVILAVLIATGLLFWCYRERRRKLGAKGRVSGYVDLSSDKFHLFCIHLLLIYFSPSQQECSND